MYSDTQKSSLSQCICHMHIHVYTGGDFFLSTNRNCHIYTAACIVKPVHFSSLWLCPNDPSHCASQEALMNHQFFFVVGSKPAWKKELCRLAYWICALSPSFLFHFCVEPDMTTGPDPIIPVQLWKKKNIFTSKYSILLSTNWMEICHLEPRSWTPISHRYRPVHSVLSPHHQMADMLCAATTVERSPPSAEPNGMWRLVPVSNAAGKSVP